jgi:hypothetical protein
MATISPEFSTWKTRIGSAKGEVFGKSLRCWQSEFRQSLGLPMEKPIVIVGHQPNFFHPGILAKFIAANRLVNEINGVLVYLVVDHYKGDAGVLNTPKECIEVASINSQIAMINQPRAEVVGDVEPFSSALKMAEGDNAAMQFANALVQMMSPWANVHHIITVSELAQSEFGKRIVSEMQSDPRNCTKKYNLAVEANPDCHVLPLKEGALPLWKLNNEWHPRALVLTLLARLVACDLFVHGTGGIKYDRAMEQWCHAWLGCSPCNAVMATATLRLETEYQTMTDARRAYYSPPFEAQTKMEFLHLIEKAPYKSLLRKIQFQRMHRWLNTIQPALDIGAINREENIARKRNWAFPLYTEQQLVTLFEEIQAM